MQLRISGYSTALYSTFWYIEPLHLMLDCGDGAAAMLRQRGRAVKKIMCSHADRDHLTGLFRFLEANSASDRPTVYYPEGCGSFPAMADFTAKFDPQSSSRARWEPLRDGGQVHVTSDLQLQVYANRHIPVSSESATQAGDKSLSCSLVQNARKLKREFVGLPSTEIANLRAQVGGEERLFDFNRKTLLSYSGDTPLEDASFWREPNILIHEATFLDRETAEERNQLPRHSTLPDVMRMASEMPRLQHLILGHFSVRYSAEEIREAALKTARELKLPCTLHLVLPGEFVKDILAQPPLWDG